jgi:hypothetical protein
MTALSYLFVGFENEGQGVFHELVEGTKKRKAAAVDRWDLLAHVLDGPVDAPGNTKAQQVTMPYWRMANTTTEIAAYAMKATGPGRARE